MKIISADALSEQIKNEWDMQELYLPVHFLDLVEEQEIAYDVEQVAEKMKDYLEVTCELPEKVVAGAVKIVKQPASEDTFVCKWNYDESYEYAKSDCGSMDTHRIDFSKFKFCPFCGKRIKIRTTYELEK